jgi:hypothetical protein
VQLGHTICFSAAAIAMTFTASAFAEEVLYAWPPNPASFPGDTLAPAKINYEQKKAECAKRGEWGRFDSNVEYCRTPEEAKRKEECLKDGGTWHKMGMLQLPGCTKTFEDANKECQANNDCLSKKCLIDKSSEEHGKCAATDEPFGCFGYFEKNSNGTRPNMCVD